MGQASRSLRKHSVLSAQQTPWNVEDYVLKITEFSTLCTTCRGDWASTERDDILSFYRFQEALHGPTRAVRKALKAALQTLPLNPTKLTQLIRDDRKATALAAHSTAIAAMDDMARTMTAAYARDIFKIMAQELRFKNPWERLVRNAIVLGDALRGQPHVLGDLIRETLQAIKESQERFEHYVQLVVESDQFLEPMSSGAKPEPIVTAADWAKAIRTLPRVFAMLDSHVAPLMQELRTRVDKQISEP